MTRRVTLVLALIGLSLGTATTAGAVTLTFNPGPFGAFGPGTPTTEGVFTYDAKSGTLFKEETDGHPAPDMEGGSLGGGGVLKIVRNDVVGGLFTFAQSDIRFEFNAVEPITFQGLKGGVSQGVDILNTPGDSSWATAAASNLAGKLIDELDVTLIGTPSTAADIDNVVLAPAATGVVPEPTSLTLFGVGLGGFAIRRWRRRAG